MSGRVRAVMLVAILGGTSTACLACREAPLVHPPRLGTEPSARPVITWAPLPGARSYRVRIESRIPNGRTLETIDTEVPSPPFVPLRALANELAVVKVQVTADCAASEMPPISERGPAFFLDPRAACGTPRDVRISNTALQWMAGAAATEVGVHDAVAGTLVARRIVEGTRFVLPETQAALIVTLRSRCGEVWSELVYRIVAAATP